MKSTIRDQFRKLGREPEKILELRPEMQVTPPALPAQLLDEPLPACIKPAQPLDEPLLACIKPAQPLNEPLLACIKPAQPLDEPLPACIKPAQPLAEPLPACIKPAHPSDEPLPAGIEPAHPSDEPLPAGIEPAHPTVIARYLRGPYLRQLFGITEVARLPFELKEPQFGCGNLQAVSRELTITCTLIDMLYEKLGTLKPVATEIPHQSDWNLCQQCIKAEREIRNRLLLVEAGLGNQQRNAA